MAKVKLRGSTASYRDSNRKNDYCDVVELANTYRYWGEIPKSINDTRAQEISILAQAYLASQSELKLLRKKRK